MTSEQTTDQATAGKPGEGVAPGVSEAGAELNALVAVLAEGYRWLRIGRGRAFKHLAPPGVHPLEPIDPSIFPPAEDGDELAGDAYRWCPRYSTDMNDAMRAAVAVGLFDCDAGEEGMLGFSYGAWRVETPSRILATGETPALAIARAVIAVSQKGLEVKA